MENILKNNLLTVSLISVIVVCVPGCIKEVADNQAGPVGTDIVFGAASGYQNGEETRTIYSGSLYGSSTSYERIDWVNSDQMTVFYNQQNGAGTYVVTGVSGTTDQVSHASVEPVSGKLVWGSGTTHRFYSMYPANGGNNTLTSAGHVTGTIPGQQTITYNSAKGKYLPAMEYGYMVAYADNSNNGTISNGRVTLPFTPAMTAFEFKLRMTQDAGQNPPNLTKFELISDSDPLVGTFEFNILGGNSDGATWTKTVGEGGTTLVNTGTIIEATFPSGGVALPAYGTDNYLDFTVFALPVQISGLTVRLTYADGKKRTLPLKENDSFKTFLPCKKYIITNENVPGEDWEYNLAPIEDIILYGHGTSTGNSFTVNSTRTRGETTESVNWGVQYSTDGTTWSDTAPAGFNISGVNTASPTANITAVNSSAATSTPVTVAERTARLQANSVESSFSAPYDLSMHTVQGGSRSGPVTANCYIVKAPGYYMFPLVYGNSIDANRNASINANVLNGGNRESYAPTEATNSKTYLTPFLNVKDQGIRYPNILKDLGIEEETDVDAVIVWQDVPSGSEIIQESSLDIIDAPANAGVKNCKYIKFQIEQERIRQGNILIALRDASDQIVWSWHIWVTDENMAQIPLKNKAGDWTNVMPVDVGWCDTDVTRVTKYADRDFYVRVYQTGEGTKETTFHVIQYGESTSVSAKSGSSTYYQWGRKDPFLPSDGNRTLASNKNYTSSYGITTSNTSVPVSKIVASPSLSANRGISHPYVAYYFLSNDYDGGGNPYYYRDKYSLLDWFDGSHVYDHYNLWDTNCQDFYYTAASSYPSVRTSAVKSIYDPCPPQFRVPTLSEIDNISMSSASYQSSTSHWDVYCNGVDTSNGVFVIPWQCCRQASGINTLGTPIAEGGLDDLGVCFYMSSTPFTGDRTANIGGERVTNIPGFGSLLMMTNFYGSNFIQFPIETYPNCGMFPVRPVAE